MPATDLFFDYSSNNHPPDLAKLYKQGYRVLALKATEGTTYTWDLHAKLADEWHKQGTDATVWHYAFLQPSDPGGQGAYFVTQVKDHLRAGDRLVADVEVAGVTNGVVQAFFDRVRATSTLAEEIYGSPYFLRDHGVRPEHGQGLWLADYASKPAFIPPGWARYDAWQFTDAGKDPSTGSRADESHLTPSQEYKPVIPTPPSTPKHMSTINGACVDRLNTALPKRKSPLYPKDRDRLEALIVSINHALNVK